jgi:3-oxoacyl-(acyl-carrier-protein) synthase/malonyl CoA-acyl carrier protein transacylase
MACIFPGAPDLETFWNNVRTGVDAIQQVPPGRWDPVFFDPLSSAVDRFYCRRGGFIDDYAEFDPLEYGVMPREAEGAEPDQLLVLKTANLALVNAGYRESSIPHDSTGIIVGRGNYIGAAMTRLEQHVRTPEQLLVCLRKLVPGISNEQLDELKLRFQDALGPYGPDTAIGLVPNLTASRVAKRLDLLGPAYTIDAACASSLLAVAQACDALASGSSDLMLAGGVHLSHHVAFWSVFCQLGALSRAQQIRPFDKRADGLLIGEGVGMVVLKRLADARRSGDRIYAVLRGWGVSSDGRQGSLMNPSSAGQLIALERAWKVAGADPRSVGLVEAHGTATPVGDAAELQTLRQLFGSATENGHRIGLGSVKSMIGHAMPAAGAAGLIKAALALHHGVLPPTLHCEEPQAAVEESGFRLIAGAEDWPKGSRAGLACVNAFGFGGINAHVVLEAANGARLKAARRPAAAAAPTLRVLAACDPESLASLLRDGAPDQQDGKCRIAIVNPTPERLNLAERIVERGQPWRGRDGIWFSTDGLLAHGGRWLVVFPGLDAGFRPSYEGIGDPLSAQGSDLEALGAEVFSFNQAVQDAVARLGVRPDAYAGHSIGEWNAIVASGMLPYAAASSFMDTLRPNSLKVPDVVYLAAGCSFQESAGITDGLPGVEIANDNCPHQTVLSCPPAHVDEVMSRLRSNGVLARELSFRSGVHSSGFHPYLSQFEAHLERIDFAAPHTPVWSATSCEPYPAETESIRGLLAAHLVRPVRFRELILRLHAEGFRVFVQAGSGSLPGFIDDTLKGTSSLSISANVARRSGREQLAHLAAALFVEGLNPDLSGFQPTAKDSSRTGRKLTLTLGVPLVQPDFRPLSVAPGFATPGDSQSPEPLVSEFKRTIQSFVEAVSSVEDTRDKAGSPQPRGDFTGSITLSVERYPCLMDHCLFPQAEDCTDLAERYPVVPITMAVELAAGIAKEASGMRHSVRLKNVRSLKWLAVPQPLELEFRCRASGRGSYEVSLGDYFTATVHVARTRPDGPSVRATPAAAERAAPISAEQMYGEGWMFHGPAYRGVFELGPLTSDGIRGKIVVGDAPGAILDNAGQLLGYWVMLNTKSDRLAMPVEIQEIEFFGATPAPGAVVDCTVRVKQLASNEVFADMELSAGNRMWARVRGWKDRRFVTDSRIWPVIRQPDRHLLATIIGDGLAVFRDTYSAAPSRDYLSRRFLTSAERKSFLTVPPSEARRWLAGRIAAKDSIRAWLWDRGCGPLYPADVEIFADASGRLAAKGRFSSNLQLAIVHGDEFSVALARESSSAGLAIERIDQSTNERISGILAAKQAATGRTASPSLSLEQTPVRDIDGQRFQVGSVTVNTMRHDQYIIAWTA